MPITIRQLNADTTFLLDVGNYTILFDPWLTGASPIWHASFAVSSHASESAIQSLAELDKSPDLIIISQAKNDHCNKETLSTLPKSWQGMIAATPAAAKKIQSWKLFSPEQVLTIPNFNSNKAPLRIPITTFSFAAQFGEITIANIPEPYDISAVHNALGVTYQSPSQERPTSILYTPHGISGPLLVPYIETHLRPINALPLDILFHSLNLETNPMLLGGVVANGAPGGLEIVRAFMGKVGTWIGAHDEVKVKGGIAVKLLRGRVFEVDQVERVLSDEGWEGCKVRSLGCGQTLELGDVAEEQAVIGDG